MLKTFGKNQQATRISEQDAARRLNARRMLKFTYLILIASLVAWGWQILQNPQTLPIESVQIHSTDSFINRSQILKAVQPYINAGFFNVDRQGISNSLLSLPWVAAVTVTRIWPHTLVIQVSEQQPIARWGDKGLINQKGKLFYPPLKTYPEGLPLLLGPVDQEKQLLLDFQQLTHILAATNISIENIKMNPQQAITLLLSYGIELALGRNNTPQRLQRFVEIYPKVFLGKTVQAAYVDMRYTDGMAVKWKQDDEQLGRDGKGVSTKI